MFLSFVVLPALFELGCDVCSVRPFWSNCPLPVQPLPRYQKWGQWGLGGPSLEGGGSALPPVTSRLHEWPVLKRKLQGWERDTQTGRVRSRRLKKTRKVKGKKKNKKGKPHKSLLSDCLSGSLSGPEAFQKNVLWRIDHFMLQKSSLWGQHLEYLLVGYAFPGFLAKLSSPLWRWGMAFISANSAMVIRG